MQLTLTQIDCILRRIAGGNKKYPEATAKLKEVRAYLVGESSVEPRNPFLPLTQLPASMLQ